MPAAFRIVVLVALTATLPGCWHMLLTGPSGPPSGSAKLTESIERRVHRLPRDASPEFREGRLWHSLPVEEVEQRLGYALDLRMSHAWSEVRLLRYVYPSDSTVQPLHARPLLGSLIVFDLDKRGVAPQASVAQAGLERGAAFGVWGTHFDGPRRSRSSFDPPSALVYATNRPDEFLLFREGGPAGHVLVLDPGFWEEQPGFRRWEGLLDRLAPLASDPGHAEGLRDLAALLAPHAELGAAEAAAAARAEALGRTAAEARWALVADEVAAFDAAYADADPVERYDMLLDLHALLADMHGDDGELIAPAREWRDARFDGWEQLAVQYWSERTEWQGGLIRWLTYHPNVGLNRVQARGLHGEAARRETERERRWLAETPALFHIEAPSLYDTIVQRVEAARAITDDDAGILERGRVADVCHDLRARLEHSRPDAEQDSFHAVAEGALYNLLWPRETRRWLDDIVEVGRACRRLERFLVDPEPEVDTLDVDALMQRLADLAADVELLLGHGNATVYDVGQGAPRWIAPRLEQRGAELAPGPEQAVLLALAETLREEQDGHALALAPALMARARAFDPAGDEDARLAAHAELSAFGVATTGVAAELSGILGVPLGREIAARAEQHADAGAWGLAALDWYRAASIGALAHAPPIRSAWLRLGLAAYQVRAVESPTLQRELWLDRARSAGLTAVGRSLPRVDADDPARELQRRFVAFQLGGRAELARTLGVRLDGLGDVPGPPDGAPHVLARSAGGGVRWVPADADPAPLDLAAWAIDADGWSRLRALRDALEQDRADLDAASSALSMDLPELRARRDAISDEVASVSGQLDQGLLSAAEGRERLESLQREERALNRAIDSYNSRAQHVESTRAAFNEKVREHNALLVELQQQLAVAFEQLLLPAAQEYVDTRLAQAGLSAAEYVARRWLLGLSDTRPAAVPDAVEHPETLARRVRDVNDPARGAALLEEALAARLADPRRRGVELATHLRSLAAAVEDYLRGYGSVEFAEHVWPAALRRDEELLRAALHGLESDTRRNVRRACGLDG